MVIRDTVEKGSRNFGHRVFFNAHWHRTVHEPFRLHRNATTAAGIEPTTFGSAAELPSHCSAVVDCNDFEIDSVRIPKGTATLAPDAVPTILPNLPAYLTLKTPAPRTQTKRRHQCVPAANDNRKRRRISTPAQLLVDTNGATSADGDEADEASSSPSSDAVVVTLAEKSHQVRRHRCCSCGYETDQISHLTRHLRVHTGERPFKCHLCPQGCTQKVALDAHLRSPAGERPYKCCICHQGFKKSYTLRVHLRTHTGSACQAERAATFQSNQRPEEETRPGFFCCKQTRRGSHVIRSRSCFEHRGLPPILQLRIHGKPHQGRRLQCDSCDYETDRPSRMIQHRRTHTGERPFKCHLCPQDFSVKATLVRHLHIHTGKRPFKCHFCPQSFSLMSTLKNHLCTHTGKKPHKCHLCPQSFSHSSTLMYHVSAHFYVRWRGSVSGVSPRDLQLGGFFIPPSTTDAGRSVSGCRHYCKVCDYETTKPSNLIRHMRVHTGKWPFQCHLCPRGYSEKTHLKDHLHTHTGERPYKCHLCPQSFSQKRVLNDHLCTHTGEQRYKCHLCLQSFRNRMTLKNHLSSHTGELPYQCPSCFKRFKFQSNLRRNMGQHKRQ
ncbi:hypothetical protein HPB51_014193 [Rhipicephalus microplus]|uniref:C2H2-type domain-containing protein n=1 Tax=Rhipicephalus microplus TaxID=6941 RepID=A0A9J6E1U8_RHIMP|nr:hypothetical protein HPB51_014193 [Rhipicephalus microplus]